MAWVVTCRLMSLSLCQCAVCYTIDNTPRRQNKMEAPSVRWFRGTFQHNLTFCRVVLATSTSRLGKSILQVPDTGTRVLDNTRPFLCSSIVSFWITPAHSKERKYHIFRQYWNTKNVKYSPILGRSSIWDLKYTFSVGWIKLICMTTDAKKKKNNLENDLDLLDVDKVKKLNNIFNVWIMLNFIMCTRDPAQFQPFKTPSLP